jgi:uncharacterized membrane protein
MVDFNSVAVSGPTRAYTLDVDGPIDPTFIHSQKKVVNICKDCGSENLFKSHTDHQNHKKIQNEIQASAASWFEKRIFIMWPLIMIFCMWAAVDQNGWVGLFQGFFGVLFSAILIEWMNSQTN